MKGLAIAALVLGIIGILVCWIGIGIIPAVLALIFGFIAYFKRVARGMAIAGLVLGIIGTIISAGVIYLSSHPEIMIEEFDKTVKEVEKEAKKIEKRIEQTVKKLEFKEETIDYASLQLVALERTNEIKLRPKTVITTLGREKIIYSKPGAYVFGIGHTIHTLQPGKGEDALILVVKVGNPGNKYIFPSVMPGHITDTKDIEYREEADAVEGIPEKPDYFHTGILLKDQEFSLIPSSSATEDIIAPGESFNWVFIFHIPKERKPNNFLFKWRKIRNIKSFAGNIGK